MTLLLKKCGDCTCDTCKPTRLLQEIYLQIHHQCQLLDTMLECESGSWRLLYCEQKLTKKERENLEEALVDVSFTCGAPLQDLELPGKLANVYVQHISCEEPIERLYYTAKYPPICVYCAHSLDKADSESGYLSQCVECKDKPRIKV